MQGRHLLADLRLKLLQARPNRPEIDEVLLRALAARAFHRDGIKDPSNLDTCDLHAVVHAHARPGSHLQDWLEAYAPGFSLDLPPVLYLVRQGDQLTAASLRRVGQPDVHLDLPASPGNPGRSRGAVLSLRRASSRALRSRAMLDGPAVHALACWFQTAFGADELVRELRGLCGNALVESLPDPDKGAAAVAHAAAVACARHGLTERLDIWKGLVGLRPRREAEVVALAARFGCTLRPAADRAPLWPLPAGHEVLHTWGRGRFQAVAEVGRGGAATVYRAWDGELRCWRALKVLHPELLAGVDDKHRRRFRREASIMARLVHPHVVQVVDIGADEVGGVERPWQVCEWVEGGDLAGRITKGALELDEALGLLLPVLDAQELAWSHRVVHRDVKPANVLLTAEGQPKLCDFGLALLDEDGLSRSRHSMVGTPEFMAPEQVHGKVDHRADIYAWTATLACALSGRATPGYLWSEDDREDLLGSLAAGTRARVAALVRAGCAKKPDQRLGSAQAIRAALAAPVTPGPDALEARLRDLLRTPPWWAAAADLAAVLDVPVEQVRARVKEGEPMLRLVSESLRGLAAGAGTQRVLTLPGGVKLPLRWVPGGTFWMGSPDGVGDSDERPRHPATLTQGYWLGETPVTQAQWQALTRKNPSHFKGADRPVETVSWQECVDFCRDLGKRMPEAAGIRLPTEAEWERACRAGTDTRWCHGDEETGLERFTWYGKSAEGQTAPVGERLPNPWGLHEVHGDVWEWCQDEGYRPYAGAVTNPAHADGGVWRLALGARRRLLERRRLVPVCVPVPRARRVPGPEPGSAPAAAGCAPVPDRAPILDL